MGTNYDNLRLIEMRALVKERGLQGYYRLKMAELIVLLRDASKAWPDEPMPSQLTQHREALPGLQSLRHLPPPPESSLHSCELERAFRGAYRSFRETRGSVINLTFPELHDLDSMKIKTTAWIRFKVEVEDEDGNVIRVDTVDKAFNSRMKEMFQGSNLDEVIDELFAHMKAQIKTLL